jgi:hypothetical protein
MVAKTLTDATPVDAGRNVKRKPKRSSGRLTRILMYMAYAALALAVLEWIRVASGDNDWQLEIDEDGTQIYSLKSPGVSIKKIKGVTTYKASLSNMIAPFIDESIQENCKEWLPTCVEYKILSSWDPQLRRNIQLWTVEIFPPFKNREILLRGTINQDKATKVVTIDNIAAPNTIPPNDCCVRLSHVHNVWRYTPLGNGEVRIEFTQDLDMGGFFPDFLLNLGGPDELYKMLHDDMPGWLNQERYRSAKLDFIREPT